MGKTAAEKAIANEIQERVSREMESKAKWECCSKCKTEVIDIAGHDDVLHRRNFIKYNHEGVRLLLHCPLCLPDPKVFRAKDSLLDHMRDIHD